MAHLKATELPPHPPNPLVLQHWARELVAADDARKKAERDYQQALLRLRGALKDYES